MTDTGFDFNAFQRQVIEEFRANEGRVGRPFEGSADPGFGDYQRKTNRAIPVVTLTRIDTSGVDWARGPAPDFG